MLRPLRSGRATTTLAALLCALIGIGRPAMATGDSGGPDAAAPRSVPTAADLRFVVPAGAALPDLAAPTFGSPDSVAAARGVSRAAAIEAAAADPDPPATPSRVRLKADPSVVAQRQGIANAVVAGVFLGGSAVTLAYGLTGVTVFTRDGFNYFAVPWLAISGGGGILFVVGLSALATSVSKFGKARRLRAGRDAPPAAPAVVEPAPVAGMAPEGADRFRTGTLLVPVVEF